MEYHRDTLTMAELYKRYMPPKSTANQREISTKNSNNPRSTNQEIQDAPAKKRKRERTQEEIAERKAKKLRKKGIDSATDDGKALVEQAVAQASKVTGRDGSEENIVEVSTLQGQGEFAHIKSAKKRHKLEKEARKARKDAEKSPNSAGSTEENVPGSETYEEDISLNKSSNGRFSANDKKGKAREVVKVDVRAEDDTDNLHRTKKRSKEEKREKKRAKGTVISTTADAAAENHSNGNESIPLITPAEMAKEDTNGVPTHLKRRHKLENVLSESQPAEPIPNDDEHLRKHTGILSKFQKSAELAQSQTLNPTTTPALPVNDTLHVQRLTLPDPDPEQPIDFEPDNFSLPAWLANPIVVPSDRTATFSEMGLRAKTVEYASRLGFSNALPVQQAVVPLLLPPGFLGSSYLPGSEAVLPDVAVSAATGSGKTMAYILPIIESLQQTPRLGRLRALVVVPTRELVVQVAAVADSLTKGTDIKVAMVSGAGSPKDEVDKLVKRGQRFDPRGYADLMKEATRRIYPPDEESDEFALYLADIADKNPRTEQRLQDAINCPGDHLPTYESAVDIIVATPGRLLEHISGTLGFSLAHLEWLVLDEADKLLDNQYEGFLETIRAEIHRPRTAEEQDAREKYLRAQGTWEECRERHIRKVLLSATMTKDISKLTLLKLQRPKLVVVRSSQETMENSKAEKSIGGAIGSIKETTDGFELPPTLVEYCIPVGDGSEKPLVALELLISKICPRELTLSTKQTGKADGPGDDTTDDSGSSSDSADSSSLSSDESDSASEIEDPSTAGDDDEELDSRDETEAGLMSYSLSSKASLFQARQKEVKADPVPTVLIFTSSNESAHRFSYLLRGLMPQWANWITTMTKFKPGKGLRTRSKLTEPAIVISSDRAARGLDNFGGRSFSHVVQYDVPRSLTSYIHRVGRTARAGRNGDAWTLYTHAEARWFVNEITKAKNVKRAGEVERVKLFMGDEKLREKYQEILASMREEVYEGGNHA